MSLVPSIPTTFTMLVFTMVAWGSWTNAIKKCGNWRFEAFYWDYIFGVVSGSILWLLTLGSFTFQKGWDPMLTIQHLIHLNPKGVLWGIGSGLVWGTGNILLITAIDIAGMAVAFPLGIGLATFLGTTLAFVTNPTATQNPLNLFAGLTLLLLTIILNGAAYKQKNQVKTTNFKLGIFITIICGILIGLFPTPFNYAFKYNLTAYEAALSMAVGGFFATTIVLPLLMRKPLVVGSSPVTLREYTRAPKTWHLWGLGSGILWITGTVFNLIAATQPAFSVAIAFALGQGSILIATLWGVFVWKEFKTAPPKAHKFMKWMFPAFVLGIILLASSSG